MVIEGSRRNGRQRRTDHDFPPDGWRELDLTDAAHHEILHARVRALVQGNTNTNTNTDGHG